MILAAAVTVVTSPDGDVHVEFRDHHHTVVALAGLKPCAALDLSTLLTGAIERTLCGPMASAALH